MKRDYLSKQGNKIMDAGMIISRILFILGAWVSSDVFSETVPAGNEEDWTAQWIGPDLEEMPRDKNLWIAYRKSFSVEELPEKMDTRIAVDSKYWLWVNDQLIVREGALKRGPTPEDTYYDRIDLAPYLEQGENTIGVLVWYWGKEGFSHQSSGQPGLVFEASGEGIKWVSDRSWKMKLHPAFEMTGDPHPNYRLPENNIRFNGTKDIGLWWSADYNTDDWDNADVFGMPPVSPWNRLVERPIPLWKDFGLKAYPEGGVFPLKNEGKVIVMKLPYNAQVTPYFEITAPAGLTVDIRMDNYNGGGPTNVRAEYVTQGGRERFECLGWMNGHSVHYRFPEGVEIHDLKYRESGYGTEFAGIFHADDAALNQLWEEARRTLYVTMRDTYMDCPDRERSQWWGDAVIEMGEAFYALERSSDLLIRKGIRELVNWQRADGTLFSPIPAGNWNTELPTQMLASVGWFGFWTYYVHSGDEATIRYAYPHVKRYMDVWELGENGLVVVRKGDWTWGDWGENKDLPVIFNGWYYLALKGQRAMAELCGADDDIREIEQRMASIEANFNKGFWNGSEYRSNGYEGLTDERGHGLAVLAGLAKPEEYSGIRKVFQDQRNASPYMEKYVLEALFQMGYAEDALARMKERYSPMLEDDLSTLYEGWGLGSEGFGGGSYNHAWSGGPLTLMSQYVAGISPLEPGYTLFSVKPQLGKLKKVFAQVRSVQGLIEVKVERTGDDYDLKVEVPEGSRAIVSMPVGELSYNGKVIWIPGQVSEIDLERIVLLSISDRVLELEVPEGEHAFLVEASPFD